MLAELEDKARKVVLLLCEHAQEAMVSEAFGPLGPAVDRVHEQFVFFFRSHRDSPRPALRHIVKQFPFCFVVFVADLARRDHDGANLWGHVFEELGFPSDLNTQREFKAKFYALVKHCGFPRFKAEEDDFYLLYTALFHGGLSKSVWTSLWQATVLPYARKMGQSIVSSEDARVMLEGARDRNDLRADANVFVIRILNKTPDATLLPLLKAALELGVQVEGSRRSSESYRLLSGANLPETAITALQDVLGGNAARPLVYIPKAELRLDPVAGQVLLHWNQQQLPKEAKGLRVEYRINGHLEKTQAIVDDVRHALLEETEIAVDPAPRFDAELTLVNPGKAGKNTVLSRSSHTFDRTRPGSFEFVQERDGAFRLRKPSMPLSKTQKIAFLTKRELWVVPGPGMEPLEEYDAQESWGGASIQIFNVGPGAAGSIVNRQTQETVASWLENYSVEVDRRYLIGKTADNRDLYCFAPNSIGTNAALPVISIETYGTDPIQNDLEVSCVCDGSRVSLMRRFYEPDRDQNPEGKSKLVVYLNEAQLIPWMTMDGLVEITQKASGSTVLRYRFAVVPIQSFKLIEAKLDADGGSAAYEISARQYIKVEDDGYTWNLSKDETYEFEAPLAASAREMIVSDVTSSKEIAVRLSLAAMEVRVSSGFLNAVKDRKLTMEDCCSALDGRLSIKTAGRRTSRKVFVMSGSSPLLYRDLYGAGEQRVDLLASCEAFAEEGLIEHDFCIYLCINYGCDNRPGAKRETPVDMLLAQCESGQGLGEVRLLTARGNPCMVFTKPARSAFCVSFLTRRGKLLAEGTLDEGERSVALSNEVIYQLDRKREVRVSMAPKSLFGMPDADKEFSFPLRRPS